MPELVESQMVWDFLRCTQESLRPPLAATMIQDSAKSNRLLYARQSKFELSYNIKTLPIKEQWQVLTPLEQKIILPNHVYHTPLSSLFSVLDLL